MRIPRPGRRSKGETRKGTAMTKSLLIAAVASLVFTQDSPFNGKDLTGWKLKGAEAKN